MCLGYFKSDQVDGLPFCSDFRCSIASSSRNQEAEFLEVKGVFEIPYLKLTCQ